jgi:enoyl-CoA hydratase/carnithine racemase
MCIRSERQGNVLVVTIDRPEARNALSRDMGKALWDCWYTLRDNPELRVGVLTGAGDKAFCAGADLKEIGSYYGLMTPIQRREVRERDPGLGGITRNLEVGKPIIAAINGHCLAGGLELALACDMRVAAEHATFGLPEVRRGIIPGAGGTQRLPRAIPLGVALELLCTGDSIDAKQALQHGLVNRVVPKEDVLASALDLANRIARNAPLAVQAARSAARRGIHLPLEEGLRIEELYAEPVRATEDAKEGVLAFVEKREAEFIGR